MTEAHELLAALRRAGMRVSVRDDGALVLGPSSRLTDELRATVRRLKPALVAVLTGNGAERSQLPRVQDYAAALAATAPPGGWPLAWRHELRAMLPALLRRVERAESRCEANAGFLRAEDDASWVDALREFEVVMFDVRAVLMRLDKLANERAP